MNNILFAFVAFLMASAAIGLAILLTAIFCRVIDGEKKK